MIEIRLRVSLKFYDRRAADLGYRVLLFTIPARTTLTVLDLFDGAAFCSTPDGKKVLVGREQIREHGYKPRKVA